MFALAEGADGDGVGLARLATDVAGGPWRARACAALLAAAAAWTAYGAWRLACAAGGAVAARVAGGGSS